MVAYVQAQAEIKKMNEYFGALTLNRLKTFILFGMIIALSSSKLTDILKGILLVAKTLLMKLINSLVAKTLLVLVAKTHLMIGAKTLLMVGATTHH